MTKHRLVLGLSEHGADAGGDELIGHLIGMQLEVDRHLNGAHTRAREEPDDHFGALH